MKYIFYILFIISLSISYSLIDWQYYILDKKPTGLQNSIVLDSNDRPYILFYYSGGNALTLAHWIGYKWIYEPISSYEHYGNAISMAIDKNDNLHIAFIDTIPADLMYGFKNNEGWHIYRVDEDDYPIESNSIAIDSKGYPHIAYCREFNNDNNMELRYAYFDGTKWNVEVVDNEYEYVGKFCSLALDSNDYPHISYMERVSNQNKYNLKYARWDGTKWIKEVLSTEENRDLYTSIAIDKNNRPHIAYHGYSYLHYKSSVFYIYFDGFSWKKELIDVVVSEGLVSIVLNSNDYPCIAYKNYDGIKYAHWDGSKWIKEYACQKGAGLGQRQLSLALDSNDYPHITCDNYFTEPWSIWYIWYGEPLVDIDLTSFSAKPSGSAITLNWSISTDEDISGFNLYRRVATTSTVSNIPTVGENVTFPLQMDDNTQWTRVNTSLITGTNPYSYTDRDITPETNYEYKLEAVVYNKNETLGTTQVTSGNKTPGSFEIARIYPTPASSQISIDVIVPEQADIYIAIYDITGRRVGTIANEKYNSGEYTITGDVSGLSDGVYIVRMTGEDLSASKSFVIAK